MRTGAFLVGLLAGMVAIIVLIFLVQYSGIINMTASQKPGPIDKMGAMMAERALVWRAPDEEMPLTADGAAAFDHFASACVQCHGAPDAAPAKWAEFMLPKPPELSAEAEEYTDGELFYIIKHGIRMTGMPAFGDAHQDKDVWNMVALLRHINDLTAEQTARLREAVDRHDHRHTGATHESDSAQQPPPEEEDHSGHDH